MFWMLPLLALAAAAPSTDPNGAKYKHKVVVVGAGAAGFAATAWLLENNFTDVLVLEASDRIGGRVHTVTWEGEIYDLGGEFIHGEKDNVVYESTPHELFVSYMPLVIEEKNLYADINGNILDRPLIAPVLQKAVDILYIHPGIEHVAGSLADYFEPRFQELLKSENVSQELGEAIRYQAELLEVLDEAADTPSQLGSYALGIRNDNEGDQTLKWKCLGFKTIFSILSKKFYNSEELPVVNHTLFNKEVTRIERKDGEVEVQCADGSKYLADHVIVTVSLGVLKKNAAGMFSPPLPDKKMTAIQTLGFGCVAKVFIKFPFRWWPKDIEVMSPLFSKSDLHSFRTTTVHGRWTSYVVGLYPVLQDDRALCAWVLSDGCRTVEQLPQSQVAEGILELLNFTFGKTYSIPGPVTILRTDWSANPLILGSWSYRSTDSDRLNITNDDLAAPVFHGNKPVLLFAGETTHSDYYSTVHGAIDTGRREAKRIIDYYNI